MLKKKPKKGGGGGEGVFPALYHTIWSGIFKFRIQIKALRLIT